MNQRWSWKLLIVIGLMNQLSSAQAETPEAVKLGAATYFTAPKNGDKNLPTAPYLSAAMLKRAAPTNQWYSTLAFKAVADPIFVQPMSIRTVKEGLEWVLPTKVVVPTERQDVEINYPHVKPLLLSPMAFEPGVATLANAHDWSIDISFANQKDDMRVSVAHGMPFAYVRLSRGNLRLTLPSEGERFGKLDRALALRVNGQAYALFGPTGVRWEAISPTQWVAHLPADKHYLSLAVLPDDQAETLNEFAKHAYAFVKETRVDWQYDQTKSVINTTFTATTEMMEGADNGPLLGLYPHHWYKNPSVEGKLGKAFDTVRGKIRLLAAHKFNTQIPYAGFVPYWPTIQDKADRLLLEDLMKSDLRNARRNLLPEGESAYWQGKGLLRIMKLLDVFEQQNDSGGREKLLELLKGRMEEWFSGEDNKRYFFYNKSLGILATYPDEFGAIAEINDHHFWYGYWIRTAAEIALRDPAWAKKDQWGGMVEKLIADVATAERGRADFPFLRNFDPYEGHSWAGGMGSAGEYGIFGNNQESSSEAVNAWVGLILWGEVTGNQKLRDLGLYLYSSEVNAINTYWFDVQQQVFPPEYKNVETAMLFGGKYAHNTWWTDEPRQIKGINMLPITTASMYLGQYPDYVRRNMSALDQELKIWSGRGKSFKPADIWQDLFAKYLALAEPDQALKNWDRWGSVELGETRTATFHWLASLKSMGTPDQTILADTPLYSVFKKRDGGKTYLVYNAADAPITVRFSDGKTLSVAAKTLGVSQ